MNICERRGIINPPNMSCRSLPIDNTRLTENPTDLLLKACHSTVSEIWGGIGHTTPPSAVLCLVTQSCPTLFVTLWTVAHQAPLSMGILQARILEWVAMPSSRGSSQPRDQTQVSHTAGRFFFPVWATREALAVPSRLTLQIPLTDSASITPTPYLHPHPWQLALRRELRDRFKDSARSYGPLRPLVSSLFRSRAHEPHRPTLASFFL